MNLKDKICYFILPVILFITGSSFSQELEFKALHVLVKERQLIEINSRLNKLDTIGFNNNIEKGTYLYFVGTLLLFEDKNDEAVSILIKSRKLIPFKEENYSLRFKVNDRLIESIGATTEYTKRPTEYIKENCEIANILKSTSYLYDCYYYQFTSELSEGNYNYALNLMRESYEIVTKDSLFDLMGNLESNIAHTYMMLNKKDSVLNYYKRAEIRFKKNNSTSKLAYLYNNIGNFYKKEGEYTKALQYFKTAYNIPLQQEEASTKNFILKNIADTYYFNKDFENAALSYELFAKIADSLDRDSYAQNIEYLNTKYQTAEKEKQLLISNQEKKQNKNIAIGLAGSLVAVSIIAFLVYKNTRRKQFIAEQEKEIEKQKTEKILKEQELTTIDAMIAGQEKERQRLASDLHDSVGATLAAAKMQFDHLTQNRAKAAQLDEVFTKTGKLLEDAYTEVRSMAHIKNSGVIAKNGLLPAVEKLAKNASGVNNLSIDVQHFGLENRIENSLEISIFRIIQELVTNIIKHSKANEANISITQHEDSINIIVEDNGVGFNSKNINFNEGMGLSSIEKRIEHLEGTLEVDATKGKGTTILIDIPL
jgi:signal transduction histidine kinase